MDKTTLTDINRFFKFNYEISINGATFCQVIKRNAFIHVKHSTKIGNQKSKGGAPLLKSKMGDTIHFTMMK